MSEKTHEELSYNPEHLAKIKEGAEVWNAWYNQQRKEIGLEFKVNLKGANLMDADLEGVNLAGTRLQGAYFHRANLKNADLGGANLQGTYFCGANLENATFHMAHLEDAHLNSTNLKGANLQRAFVKNANLTDAYLENIWLKDTNLRGSNLQDLDLSNVDLSYTKDIYFSDNKIEGAIISSTTTAPWLTLKESYTNTMLLFTLIGVLAFFLPYIVNIAVWRSVNLSQQIFSDVQPILADISGQIQILQATNLIEKPEVELLLSTINQASSAAAQTTPCLAENCDRWRIIQLLLGSRRNWGFFYAILSIILIVYNGLRLYLTQQVSILKDSEQATGLTPRWETTYFEIKLLKKEIPIWPIGGYQHLSYLHHRFVKWVFYLAILAALVHAGAWLFDSVYLPHR